MTNINIQEVEHPAKLHQDDVNNCISSLKDIIHDYVEKELLTPGEFVSSIKTALSEKVSFSDHKLTLLKDTEMLLSKGGL